MMATAKAMTFKQALAKAKKLFGKNAHVRLDNGQLTNDAKEPLREEMKVTRKELADAKTAKASQDIIRHIQKRLSYISSSLISYRCSVGHIAGVGGVQFFHVEGEGDTFEEAFEKAANRGK